MLEISAAMNSGIEDIFAFKTCCGARVFDQNLQILIRNRGAEPVVVPSRCDLRGPWGTLRISTLVPQGDQTIPAGEVKAFYCMMDEVTWGKAEELVFYDNLGNRYAVSVQPGEPS